MKIFKLGVAIVIAAMFSGTLSSAQDTDDFDSMFESSQDVVVEDSSSLVQDEKKSPLDFSSLFIPLKFYGHLDTEVGVWYNYISSDFVVPGNDNGHSFSGAFDFLNDLSFVARLDNTFTIHGTARTEFPHMYFDMHELYFDYCLMDRVYISGGKKETKWGYVRLFSDADEYEDVIDETGVDTVLYSDIVADSVDGISAIVTIPLWTGTVSAIAMYKGTPDENGNLTMINTPGSKDISYAASCEMILLGTSVNLFGRYSARNLSLGNVVGLELKHSFAGVDVYGQGIGSLDKDNEDFSKYVGTFGFYTFHEYNKIKFGVNAEGQFLYMKSIDDLRKRCAVYAGVSKAFSKCTAGTGMKWQHNFDNENPLAEDGKVELGFYVHGLFPHAQLKNGVEIYYRDSEIVKVRGGATINILVDY